MTYEEFEVWRKAGQLRRDLLFLVLTVLAFTSGALVTAHLDHGIQIRNPFLAGLLFAAITGLFWQVFHLIDKTQDLKAEKERALLDQSRDYEQVIADLEEELRRKR